MSLDLHTLSVIERWLCKQPLYLAGYDLAAVIDTHIYLLRSRLARERDCETCKWYGKDWICVESGRRTLIERSESMGLCGPTGKLWEGRE